MEILKNYPPELEIGSSVESLAKVLESQKALFHSQIGQLQNIVVSQCKLTGVNPLSQEMAAGALSIKIGKRPRDLLNPKAINYLQSVFSVKDAITKKEIRDISARFGMTATQIKEFFTNQRSKVRRLIRLSRERAVKNGFSMARQDGEPSSSGAMNVDPIPLCTMDPSKNEEEPSSSNREGMLPDVVDSDKDFINKIFSLMRKEDSFSGQVKLMEWILLMKNPSVLCWFLTQGGLMILATWLSQAASEEQTSVLYVVLKVLSHLPLNKALPVHMSAVIQGVNRLRFYGKADVSNGARVLLSRWSKMFGKSQAIRRLNGIKPSGDSQNEIDLQQRIFELMGSDSEHSAVMSEDAHYGNGDETRLQESPQAVKLLTASPDDSNKRLVLGMSTHKERRKVLLVEQPGQKAPGKNQQVTKAVAATQIQRPITADEIQKAKMRAQFMQSKHDKEGSPSKDGERAKSNGAKRSLSLLTNDLLSASETYLRPKLEAQKKAKLLPMKQTKQVEAASDSKRTFETQKKLAERPKRAQIRWKVPPEVELDPSWRMGTGQNSKEVEVQRSRISREKESFEITSDPKEPWDVEMDYDDTLTPVIPIEQLPEPEVPETSTEEQQMGAAGPAAMTHSDSGQPDLELLAVLLKNPELVFALTNGQASGLSGDDTVKLLDMLKNSSGLLDGLAGNSSQEKRVEVSLPSPTPMAGNVEVSLPSPTPASRFDVSLPSPTPTSNAAPSGWGAATANNPFTRQSALPPAPDFRLNNTPALQHQFPASSEPTVPPHNDQHILTAMIPDKANLVRAQTQPANHHHPTRNLLPDNAYVPAYSPSMPQSHFSSPHRVDDSQGGSFTKSRQGSPGFRPQQHSQSMYEPSPYPRGLPRERNQQHGSWTYGSSSDSLGRPSRSYQEVQQQQQQGRGWRQDAPAAREHKDWRGGGRRWADRDRRR